MKSKDYYLEDNFLIKEVNNLNELRGLRTVWNNLAEKQESHIPFLCFEWFETWLQHFLEDHKLKVLTIYRKDEIVAIAPFILKEERFRGIGIKKIDLVGNIYSPIRYFLFKSLDDKERKKILFYVFEFYTKFYKNWDIIDLYPIPEENHCFDLLKMVANRSRFKPVEYFCFGDWYLDEINYSGEEYLKRRPGNIRENVPVRIRKLKKIGDLDFKLIKTEDVDRYMDIYYDLYSKSWQEREGVGPTFHRDLAKMMAKNGWLRLGFLFLNGSPMACQFWICANDCAYILKLFYDLKFEKYAPGKILTAEMMKYAIDSDRVKTIDYLHGDEHYKKDWTPQRRERKGILIYNNNIRGQYLYFYNKKISGAINRYRFLRRMKEIVAKGLNLASRGKQS